MPSGYNVINHVVAVRMRITGTGTFHSQLLGLEGTPSQQLADTTLSTTSSRPINLLANIKTTRIQFHGRMDAIDEHFTLKNLTFYGKPSATGYPQ